jgi:peroxisomal 3,2-trans-enoyl-CoA isomerase
MILSDKILVTAVNGAAPGWGTSSLALADLVYATPDAFFFTPFVQLGICAEACSSVTFAKIMGHQKAASLLLAGDRLTAAELESAGLVTKVIAKEKFLDTVLAQAYRIASLPADSLKLNKSMMMKSSRQELLEVNDFELKELGQKARSQEAKTAVNSFLAEQASKKKAKPAAKL